MRDDNDKFGLTDVPGGACGLRVVKLFLKTTYRDYSIYVRTLANFFGDATSLDTFTADDLRRYQRVSG